MAFRDDRDALRAKASSLEQKLSDTREQLADAKKELDGRAEKRRTAKVRSLFASARSRLASARSRLADAHSRVRASIGKGKAGMWIMVLSITAAGGVAGYVVMRLEEPSPREVLFSARGHVMDFQGNAGVDTSTTCDVEIHSHGGSEYNC